MMIDLDDVTNEDIARAIDSWIHSERDRIILKKRLIDGYTFQRISDYLWDKHKMELSVRQIKNIVPKIEQKLFRHLK
jgi:hypothetical protein